MTHLSPDIIPRLAQERAGETLWVDATGTRTWRDFGLAVETARQHCVAAGVLPGAVVTVPTDAGFDALAWLFAVAAAGGVVAPLRRGRAGEIQGWKDFLVIDWQVSGGRLQRSDEGGWSLAAAELRDELQRRDHPGLILATGGTTGVPKVLLHDLTALLATIPVRSGRPWRLLPLMPFDHIGGLDMAWRALAGAQVLVAPPQVITPDAVAAEIARHRVEVLPATPSFLNLLLLAESGRVHDLSSLRVVPYGAEPMPAGLLERLRADLPGVEFVQRFGTSETGALPVHSRGAGLAIEPGAAGFEWKIDGDELWVRSPARALGYLSGDAGGFEAAGWFRTGDLAERLPDGTIRVLGRRTELINVGGEKVLPGVVESLLLTHPAVADCRVFALPNAVLGQVVAAEVVWRGTERDPVLVRQLLHTFARSSPKCHLPTVVRLVKAIDTTGNLKKLRFLST
jgi:acyl-CoA synthetase (AMP-forming)/AMP-acid ligase II